MSLLRLHVVGGLLVCSILSMTGCNTEPPLRLQVPTSTRSIELRFYQTMSDCPTDSGTGAILDESLTVVRPSSKLIRNNDGSFSAQDETALAFPDSENTSFVLGVIARNANCSLVGYRCIPTDFNGDPVDVEITAMPPTGGGCGGSPAFTCTTGLCELKQPLGIPVADGDDDGDLIPNWVECCEGESCGVRGDFDASNCTKVDTDMDGFADYLDTDADGDRVLDRSECSSLACSPLCGNECGGDCFSCQVDAGFLAFRSVDSDGDGASDQAECGVDGDTAGELCLDSDQNGVMDHLEATICCHSSCTTPSECLLN